MTTAEKIYAAGTFGLAGLTYFGLKAMSFNDYVAAAAAAAVFVLLFFVVGTSRGALVLAGLSGVVSALLGSRKDGDPKAKG